ncbi:MULTISPECIES: hypothetical protein [Sphingomonas]|uniref:hypothetical protein n=1 Tax=Sphingomonas TaxID=13687 RepID=UPI000A6689A8|nr:hypothetical protein [Sphingomonas sp. CCH10-B3]
MTPTRPPSPKCFFVAWVLAWATAVYLPSLLIALLSLSPLPSVGNLFLDVFEVADEVSPAAKLSYGLLFGGLLMSARAGGAGRGVSINVLVGVISIALVVSLLPEYWSRGFGVGLNGVRFDPLPTTTYLVGGIASGIVFSRAEAKCLLRSHASTHQ